MFLTLTLHNFPEGLAVSVSNSASEKLGLSVALAVAFHNG
jgi:zinc transporter ZupT